MGAATRRAPGGKTLVRGARRQAADIKLADGQLNLARQALRLQAGESFAVALMTISSSAARPAAQKQANAEGRRGNGKAACGHFA